MDASGLDEPNAKVYYVKFATLQKKCANFFLNDENNNYIFMNAPLQLVTDGHGRCGPRYLIKKLSSSIFRVFLVFQKKLAHFFCKVENLT